MNSELVKSLREHGWNEAAALIEKQDRLLGLLREYYTMSYTHDLAPRMDDLRKEIDKQIAKEEQHG